MQGLQAQMVSQLQELSYLHHGGNVSSPFSFLAELIKELCSHLVVILWGKCICQKYRKK